MRITAELVLESISELPATVKADIDAFIGTLEQEPFDSNSLKSYGLKNDDVIGCYIGFLDDRVLLNCYMVHRRQCQKNRFLPLHLTNILI